MNDELITNGKISSFCHSLVHTGLPEAILISRHGIACEPDYKVSSLHLS